MIETSILILIGLGVLYWALRRPSSFTPPQTSRASDSVLRSYEAVPNLFVNAPERALFTAIRAALPSGYIVLTKVRLEDIVRVKHSIKDPKMIWHLRGRIKSRHVDFVIIDLFGRPIVAIELDGRSHDAGSAYNADTLKDGIFSHAGLKLKRIKAGDDFSKFASRLSLYLTSLNLAA